MLRIGVVGLGKIAQKAYLPVMAAMQDQVEWVLCTRNSEKLGSLQQKYGFKKAVHTVLELLAEKIDAVFIHTPTSTHVAYIREFLEAGVHVYVDKPISDNYAEVEKLYQLAAEQHLLLTAGFNRRFAPFEAKLQTKQEQAVIKVEKNRADTEQAVQFAVFDLMIHAVDTALFIAGIDASEELTCQYQVLADNDLLQYCALTIQTAQKNIVASINMQAGANLEISEVQQAAATQRLTDLTQLQTMTTAGVQTEEFPDWTPTLERRGFGPIIRAFVNAVANPEHPNPVSPASSLLSHRLCQNLLAQYEQQK